MATVTLITISKGRLSHLRETLPAMIAQQADELIVVDYNCPDGTGDWVEKTFPKIRCVRSDDKGPFSASKARNLGAANATGDWLCFVDADIILAPSFLSFVRSLLAPGRYFRPPPASGLWNPIVCRRIAWAGIGGFDEVIADWGGEDDDFFRRLELRGAMSFWLHEASAVEIPYDKSLRSRFHTLDHSVSQRVNLLYVQMKLDLMRLMSDDLDLQTRETLYREASRAVTANIDGAQISATLPPTGDILIPTGWSLERRVTMALRINGPVSGEPSH